MGRHGRHVGGITQKDILLSLLSDPCSQRGRALLPTLSHEVECKRRIEIQTVTLLYGISTRILTHTFGRHASPPFPE